jgi:hypothetical protein
MRQRRIRLWSFGKISHKWESVGLYEPDVAARQLTACQENDPRGTYRISVRAPKPLLLQRAINAPATDYTAMDSIEINAYFFDEKGDGLVFCVDTEEVCPMSEVTDAERAGTAYLVDPYTLETTEFEAW